MDYIPLQITSEYSLLESSCRIDRLIDKAKEMNFHSLALTDHNVMYGVIPFYKACKANGIKPIIGLKINIRLATSEATPELVLLAKNNVGYQNLMKISSRIMLGSEGEYQSPAISEKQLEKYTDGLLAISTGLNGIVQQDFVHIKHYFSMFKGQFFLGLEDHGLAEEKKLNLDLIRLARENDIQLVAMQEVYFLEKADAYAHECLLCIKSGAKITEADHPRLKSDQHYLKSTEEMAMLFAHIPEAMENTRKISEMCNLEISLDEYILPRYPLEDGMEAGKYLRELCGNGLTERYSVITDDIRERLHYELMIINKMGFNDYFLIVWDFMKFAHERNIMTGPGRGSAAGSIVAYLLRITDVDPIEHKLLFERFLNPERVTMPDIDIDFPDNRREEVIQYVMRKYGAMHVAQIITFGTLAARAAIRDVGRVLGTDTKLVDRLAKLVPGSGITLDRARKESAEFYKLISDNEEAAELYRIAKTIEGLPRHASTHAAGVVISDKPLPNTVPLQAGHDGVPLTQFEMGPVEAVGLLKMDLLGLRNLSLLERIVEMVEQGTGEKVNLNQIPFDDEKTFQLLSSGDTTGIFQLEAEFVRRVLQRLKPNCFEDIVAVNALNRPGPMDNIPVFIKGKINPGSIVYPHPDLKPILEPTYGVIVYQEQIMQLASKMAGFSLGEADLLRRAVSKKKREILDEERVHFVNGATLNGHDEKTATEIYDLIVRFANYGFNRSHAVAYSMISYRLAYLKANYPLYFMAALLGSTIHQTSKVASYIQECKQKGIKILPPSINHSKFLFTVEGDGIRFGLLLIKNVGATSVEEILQNRRGKDYQDLFDFCSRVSLKKVNQRVIESLIFAGCLDEFGQDRATLLASLEYALEYGEAFQKQISDEQLGLFTEHINKPNYTEVPPFGEIEKLNFEKEAIGLYLTGHPVEKYGVLTSYYQRTFIGNLSEVDIKSVRVAAMVVNSKVIKTKKGDMMAFVRISDETGETDLVVFPKLYQSTSHLFREGQLLFAEATVEKDESGAKLIAQKVTDLEELKIPTISSERVFLKINSIANTQLLNEVKEILLASTGNIEVYLHYADTQKTIKLGKQYAINPTNESIGKLKELLGNDNVVKQSVR